MEIMPAFMQASRTTWVATFKNKQAGMHANMQTSKQTCMPTCKQAGGHACQHANKQADVYGETCMERHLCGTSAGLPCLRAGSSAGLQCLHAGASAGLHGSHASVLQPPHMQTSVPHAPCMNHMLLPQPPHMQTSVPHAPMHESHVAATAAAHACCHSAGLPSYPILSCLKPIQAEEAAGI
eukprot:364513-Chlamydomonas_euryale.AAC.7